MKRIILITIGFLISINIFASDNVLPDLSDLYKLQNVDNLWATYKLDGKEVCNDRYSDIAYSNLGQDSCAMMPSEKIIYFSKGKFFEHQEAVYVAIHGSDIYSTKDYLLSNYAPSRKGYNYCYLDENEENIHFYSYAAEALNIPFIGTYGFRLSPDSKLEFLSSEPSGYMKKGGKTISINGTEIECGYSYATSISLADSDFRYTGIRSFDIKNVDNYMNGAHPRFAKRNNPITRTQKLTLSFKWKDGKSFDSHNSDCGIEI